MDKKSLGGKVINVNLSSLLSLKAELLRKQSEINKAKLTRSNADDYTAHKNVNGTTNNAEDVNKNTKQNKKERAKALSKDETATVYEHEDSALLEKSQRILEAKSRFYERMSRTGGNLNSDDNCLVLFNRKHQEEQSNVEDRTTAMVNERRVSSDSAHSSSGVSDNDDEDWVEYTDCLGRTRKCLRQDLDNVKKRDKELAESMPERLDQNKANWMINTKMTQRTKDNDNDNDDDIDTKSTTINVDGPPMPTESIYSDGCSFVSKHEEQRMNWERKERENLDKVDVHYQDVFFDEARQHGVGYYAFSTDEEERKRQQHQLDEARQKTIEEQERREKLREQREKIIAQRVIAAKNRQRARIGLPALDETEELAKLKKEKEKDIKKLKKTERREEKRKQKSEKDEQLRELERKHQLRPWDEGKRNAPTDSKKDQHDNDETNEWTYKPERLPLSQEQWNELKRNERNTDFAPTYDNKKAADIKPKRTNFTSMPPPAAPTSSSSASSSSSKDSASNYQMVPPPTTIENNNFIPFQSSKRERHFQRRNYEPQNDNEKDEERFGTTIPPPENLDAYLQTKAKRTKTNVELELSIEAGLRFLRDNCDKGTMSTKDSWTAKADY